MYTEYVIKILDLKLFIVKYLKFRKNLNHRRSNKNPFNPFITARSLQGSKMGFDYSDGTLLDQYKNKCQIWHIF